MSNTVNPANIALEQIIALNNNITKPSDRRFQLTDEALKEMRENRENGYHNLSDTWLMSIMGIYDHGPYGTMYAPVGMDETGKMVFCDKAEYMHDDYMVEITE